MLLTAALNDGTVEVTEQRAPGLECDTLDVITSLYRMIVDIDISTDNVTRACNRIYI